MPIVNLWHSPAYHIMSRIGNHADLFPLTRNAHPPSPHFRIVYLSTRESFSPLATVGRDRYIASSHAPAGWWCGGERHLLGHDAIPTNHVVYCGAGMCGWKLCTPRGGDASARSEIYDIILDIHVLAIGIFVRPQGTLYQICNTVTQTTGLLAYGRQSCGTLNTSISTNIRRTESQSQLPRKRRRFR